MKVPVFMYHEVNSKSVFPELTKYINKKYIMETECFKDQIEYIHSCDYSVLTVSDLAESQDADVGKSVAITFDDGYLGNYLHAFRILREFNFRATFFITTDWVGLPNMLNWEQIKEMKAYGMEIGSHTCSHALLGAEPENKAREELRRSKDLLEDKLKSEVKSVSYPNGNYNQEVNKIALDSGYKCACISDFGYWQPGTQGFTFPRVTAVSNINSLKSILEADGRYLLRNLAADRVKKSIRRVLGGKLYSDMYMKIFNLKEVGKQ